MSTNFYFKKIGRLNVDSYVYSYELNRVDVLARIHIGKRSVGWKPLFKCTEHYSSVDEIISFYNCNKNNLKIEDEYGNDLSLDDLMNGLVLWNKYDNDAKEHVLIGVEDLSGCYYKDNKGYDFTTDDFN